MKYLSVKPLENGIREFMDLEFHLSLYSPEWFSNFFQALSSWPVHSIWGVQGLVLGDVDSTVSKVFL